MGWSPFRTTGLTYHNPSLSVKGYTLFTQSAGDSVYLINMAGQIVKRWKPDGFLPGLARLLPSGNIMIQGTDAKVKAKVRAASDEELAADYDLNIHRLGGGQTGLRELDWDGNLVWSYDHPTLHHDFQVLENGNIVMPIWVPLADDFARTIRGGRPIGLKHKPPMSGDEIIEINRMGKELNRWKVWQWLDPKKDRLEAYQERFEWTHINSAYLTQDRQLLCSCRHISTVFLAEPESGEILWKVGPQDLHLQHHATIVNGGNIQVFDNGRSVSRVVEYDRQTGEVVWEYKANPAQQFFSGHLSSAQRLRLQNNLVCEGTSGRLFEINRNGEYAWEWITPIVNGNHKGDLFPWIYRAERYELDYPAFEGKDLDPNRYRELNVALGLM